MFTDLSGIKRYKINLHQHTTRSDGQKSPKEAVAVYKALGYDMIALTDHWEYGFPDMIDGMRIIPGCEYGAGDDAATGIFHIVSIGCEKEPDLSKFTTADRTSFACASYIINAIREAKGLAVLAHPAWSLNSAEMLLSIPGGFDATEIYNSVSDFGMSVRPYSGEIIDQLGMKKFVRPILAVDDTHYYRGDEGRGFIMAEADSVDSLGIAETVKQGRFYSSQGPEILLDRPEKDLVRVRCSPVSRIAFLTSRVWASGAVCEGHGLTEAFFRIYDTDLFVRAEVRDDEGRTAWSNVIKLCED